ncbi:MAG TPA: hypothetical protein VE544_07300 [Nitrososphaeraceae archaeon]|nr:hypothetical protein [Nitrososphaeraceae archaeon]
MPFAEFLVVILTVNELLGVGGLLILDICILIIVFAGTLLH